MLILGLHFGHDASIAVLLDGRPVYVLEKERVSRVRHAIGLDGADVSAALAGAGFSADDVDACAVTSTQALEYVFFDPDALSFEIDPASDIPSPHFERLRRFGDHCVFPTLNYDLKREVELWKSGRPPFNRPYVEGLRHYGLEVVATAPSFPSIEEFARLRKWRLVRPLDAIAKTSYAEQLNEEFARSFHLPIRVRLLGRSIPGILLSHHYAHASYAFFESDYSEAAIFTHDGGDDHEMYGAGMFYYASDRVIYPLTPHYLLAGHLYTEISTLLGFVDAPGKLMGLAAYGKPSYYVESLSGNAYDEPYANRKIPAEWWEFVVESARGADFRVIGDAQQVLGPLPTAIAATCQATFEMSITKAIRALRSACVTTGIETRNLVMSGGTALNCPANTKVYEEAGYSNVFVPPACDDSGLSLGAAYALYHVVLGHHRAQAAAASAEHKYLGRAYDANTTAAALSAYGKTLEAVFIGEESASDAATVIAAGGIIGWFEGRSEIGPRALGHRSILADARDAASWARVNRIKGREHWRPLAPSVLAKYCDRWFEGGPLASPYMLFNMQVVSEDLPAATHVDGTARVQTVDEADGAFFRLLKAFMAKTGVPVVLNTSFNGPGEPLVESPTDALDFFAASALDALYLDGWKVSHLTLSPRDDRDFFPEVSI